MAAHFISPRFLIDRKRAIRIAHVNLANSNFTPRVISATLGLAAGLAVLITLADPGLTIDEPLDVRPGRNYVETLRKTGLNFLRRDVIDRVYVDNKEHPPLGRWLLGIASTLVEPLEVLLLGPDPIGIYVIAGRVAPALIFAILVGFIASSGATGGIPTSVTPTPRTALVGIPPVAPQATAWAAGFALIFMPRVFAHAHIGALDLFIAAFWCIAFFKADRALVSDRPMRGMAVAGLFWGLALLVKIHAWLLPPIILVRALSTLGWKRGIVAITGWTAVGLAVFYVGWPWLWFDTLGRLRAYLGTGVERVPIYVQYFGQVYRDKEVPWHFPWVYFLATVPVGLHFLGVVEAIRAVRERDGRTLFVLATIVAILALFSTNVPVYDGERLYLLVFPLWAVVIGRGFGWLWSRCAVSRSRKGGLLALLFSQALPLILIHPFGLSYYNMFVGGLPGAERLGLELAYWSESVDPRLLQRLAREAPAGSSACLAPTLAPDQGKIMTSRDLLRRGIVLGDESEVGQSEFVVIYRRSAYWKDPVKRLLEEGVVVDSRSRQGVWLSRIMRRTNQATTPVH